MKAFLKLPAAAFLTFGAVLPVSSSVAQSVEATQVSTTSEGTVSDFGPQGIVIRTEAGRTPVRYISRDTTNYVDEAGMVVEAARVVPGSKVTVYYTKVGDTLVASKVMVRRSALAAPAVVQQTTTTTSAVPGTIPVVVPPVGGAPVPEVTTTEEAIMSEGVVSSAGTDEIQVTSQANELRRYMFSPTTTYVDEAGSPLTLDVLRHGVAVKVYYTNIGGVLRASRVVVVKRPSVVRTAVTETAVSAEPQPAVVVPEQPPVVRLDEPPPVVIEKKRIVEEAAPERVVVKKHVVEDEPEHVVVKKHVVEPEREHVVRKQVEVQEAPPVVKKHIVPEKKHVIERETTTTTTTTNGR